MLKNRQPYFEHRKISRSPSFQHYTWKGYFSHIFASQAVIFKILLLCRFSENSKKNIHEGVSCYEFYRARAASWRCSRKFPKFLRAVLLRRSTTDMLFCYFWPSLENLIVKKFFFWKCKWAIKNESFVFKWLFDMLLLR